MERVDMAQWKLISVVISKSFIKYGYIKSWWIEYEIYICSSLEDDAEGMVIEVYQTANDKN